VSSFWRQGGPGRAPVSNGRFKTDQDDLLFVLDGLKVVQITADTNLSYSGRAIHVIEFQENFGRGFGKLTREQKERFWTRGKRLMHGTLVCLCWHGTTGPEMAFGTITLRDAEKLAPPPPQRPSIGISFTDTVHGRASTQLMSALLSNEVFEKAVLLYVNGNLFTYEPVLQALKGISAKELALESYIVHSDSENGMKNELPAYITPGTTYNLGSLVDWRAVQADKDAALVRRAEDILKQVRMFDKPARDEAMHLLEQLSFLDASQLEAVMAALSSSFVIIQGPPGTGKSFVGLQIVRALLANSSRNSRHGPVGV